MKRLMLVVIVLSIAGAGYAQMAQRSSLLGRRLNRSGPALSSGISAEEATFKRENPTGTNEFGRTWKVQCAYEKFMKENPDGKNKFGKTFEEQSSYDIKSFLGFKFGADCCKYSNQCITNKIPGGSKIVVSRVVEFDQPFRMFKTATLDPSKANRVWRIRLREETTDVSYESLTNEVRKLAALFEKQYEIPLHQWGGTGQADAINPKITRFGFNFLNDNVWVQVGCYWGFGDGRGAIWVEVVKDAIRLFDLAKYDECKKREAEEARKKLLEKQKKVDIPDDEGFALLNASEPNIVKEKSEKKRSGLLGGSSLQERRLLREKMALSEDEKAEIRQKDQKIREALKRLQKAVDEGKLKDMGSEKD